MNIVQLIYYLLLLRLTHTGKAKSKISVTVQQSADSLIISCFLLRDEKVNQINWVINRGINSTKLGTYHPQFGVYIYPQFNGSVVIEGSAEERMSQIHLMERDVEQGRDVCCIFNVFPSGVLETCIFPETTAEAQEADSLTEPEQEITGGRTVVQWCLLVGGCVVCLTSIITCLYYCWRCCRHCCWRKQLHGVQNYFSDCSSDSEENTQTSSQNQPPPAAQPQQPQPQQKSFDHSRLYAKIKLDLLYGRIWKAYQGTRAWAHATPQQETPQKVYSLLGEHGPVQLREMPVDSGSVTPQPEPSSQFAQDSDLPQGLCNHVQSFASLNHSTEPSAIASQPESLNLPSKCELDTHPDSISESDPAKKAIA